MGKFNNRKGTGIAGEAVRIEKEEGTEEKTFHR